MTLIVALCNSNNVHIVLWFQIVSFDIDNNLVSSNYLVFNTVNTFIL